jgi:hypothetical protein
LLAAGSLLGGGGVPNGGGGEDEGGVELVSVFHGRVDAVFVSGSAPVEPSVAMGADILEQTLIRYICSHQYKELLLNISTLIYFVKLYPQFKSVILGSCQSTKLFIQNTDHKLLRMY